MFGYPPICYSPPNELKKDNKEREFIAVLYRHVFQKPENLASVGEIIKAKRENDHVFNLRNRFYRSGVRKDMYGHPIVPRSMRNTQTGPASPERSLNESLTRKMDSSGRAFELGSMTLNADVKSFDASGGILKANGNLKRGKKANVSKEGRENVVTNIKIKRNDSSDF